MSSHIGIRLSSTQYTDYEALDSLKQHLYGKISGIVRWTAIQRHMLSGRENLLLLTQKLKRVSDMKPQATTSF